MTKKNALVILLVLLLIAVTVIVLYSRRSQNPSPTEPNQQNSAATAANDALPQEPIAFAPVGDYSATGTSRITRSFTNNKFVIRVDAALPDPAQGTFYQAWLSKEGVTSDVVKLGTLEKTDDRWVLRFTQDKNAQDYTVAFITRESRDDALSETRLLQAQYQNVPRQ